MVHPGSKLRAKTKLSETILFKQQLVIYRTERAEAVVNFSDAR